MAALRLGVNVDHVATVRNARGGAVPDPVRAALLGDRSRRRRHHRASARGPPPHQRRRHAPPQGVDLEAAQFRDGGDRPDARHRAAGRARTPAAWCRKSAPSAPPRAASTSSAVTTGSSPTSPSCSARGHPRFAVHRALDRGAGGGGVAQGAGGRTAHRRLVRRDRAGRHATRPTTNSAACASPPRRPRALGLECHAGHGLDYDTARTIAALPEIVELNIGHFLIGEAIFVGLARDASARCARRWTRGAARRMIIGIGSDLCDIRRVEETLAQVRRALHRALLHRDRAAQVGPPRRARGVLRQALRRQGGLRQGARHRAATTACSGATWAWSICRAGKPTMRLTGGAAARLAAITPRGLRSVHPPDDHRRSAAGAGVRR